MSGWGWGGDKNVHGLLSGGGGGGLHHDEGHVFAGGGGVGVIITNVVYCGQVALPSPPARQLEPGERVLESRAAGRGRAGPARVLVPSC